MNDVDVVDEVVNFANRRVPGNFVRKTILAFDLLDNIDIPST